ncbi:MAG TPA: PfkB family carbohydrate kinase [Terriglobales bacterium]|jgi:rfaE bifunctional protein kinase chain/domain|nr:PfkB family carbohydrate kinase [Terriglobales bacterium]
MTKHPKEAERLTKIVESFPEITITVVGDLVADEFIFGEISRVSREAPVLILKHRERTVVPGGGANAINNLADLGVNVLPVGVVGDDEVGRLLLKAFRHKHIPVSGVLKDKSYTTVTKTRILAGMTHNARQQVVRVDREPETEPSRHLKRELVLAARQYARASDALLISDYGYGAASPAILDAIRDRGRLNGVPVILDSRYRMLQYSGVVAATPNEPEVEAALGVRIGNDWPSLCSAGEHVMSRMKLRSLVITRGRDGMAAFTGKHKPVDIPIFGSDQVADVTGAGDTVIATFAAAFAAGASTEEAAYLANYAGGIVVMKRGTATVSRQELLDALEQSPPATRAH